MRDALTRLRVHQQQPDPGIVIVDIDEPSLEAMSGEYGRFPWPREVYATLLAAIAQQKPAAVAFDILFTDPDHDNPEGDRLLIDTLSAESRAFSPMVVLTPPRAAVAEGVRLHDFPAAIAPATSSDVHARLLLPPQPVWKTGRVGAIDMLEDDDGKVRRYLLYWHIDGWRIYRRCPPASHTRSGMTFRNNRI